MTDSDKLAYIINQLEEVAFVKDLPKVWGKLNDQPTFDNGEFCGRVNLACELLEWLGGKSEE